MGNHASRLYHFAVLTFLQQLSAVLFTLVGLALFAFEIAWRQHIWMPWSQVVLTTLPTPLLAIGLLYGCLSIVLSAKEGGTRAAVGAVVGLCSIGLFGAFAVLRIWPLS